MFRIIIPIVVERGGHVLRSLYFIFLLALFLLSILTLKTHAQIDSSQTANAQLKTSTPKNSENKKPELFNSGLIDFQNSGQMNAAARVFKLYIGEPKRFMVPISIYSGVTGNSFSGPNKNIEQLVLGIINPTSGMSNISSENLLRIGKKKTSITGTSVIFHVGEKLLSGIQVNSSRTFMFFSTYVNAGLIFKTGAWEKDKEKNMGTFWILARYHMIRTNQTVLDLSGFPPDNNYFKGYSIGSGIEINNVLNIKLYFYEYISPGANSFDIPIFQLTFNYNLKG